MVDLVYQGLPQDDMLCQLERQQLQSSVGKYIEAETVICVACEEEYSEDSPSNGRRG